MNAKLFRVDAARVRRLALIGGPIGAAAFIALADLSPDHPTATPMAAVALLMALWWMTEAAPLAVTALLPVALFPLLGVVDGGAVAAEYMNSIIFLFLGGFLTALAMEKWGLHRRIALTLLARFGARPSSILLGFMVATAFLSMWISNTATAMMMVPIAMAVAHNLEQRTGATDGGRFAKGVLLGVAYSASIGGVATLIGTPPNLILARQLAIQLPNTELSFGQWLLFGAPLALLFLALTWLFLSRRYGRGAPADPQANAMFRQQLGDLGPATFEEKAVFVAFAAMAALWLTRADLALGPATLPGWSSLFGRPEFLNDGTVAIALSVLLFLIPSKTRPGERVMDWDTAQRLPWGIVLLFGGGFALAAGFKESGLSLWLADGMSGLAALPPLLIVLAVCLALTFLTELTSNTATAQIFLPVLAALSVSMQVHPMLLMVPAALSCSFAFMLPVATPPNAIVFGSGRLRVPDMARAGLALNLAGAVLISLYLYFLGGALLGVDLLRPPG